MGWPRCVPSMLVDGPSWGQCPESLLNLVIPKTSGCISTKSQARYPNAWHTTYFSSLLVFYRKILGLFSEFCSSDRHHQTFTGRQRHINPLTEPFLAEWKGKALLILSSRSEHNRLSKTPDQWIGSLILTNGNSITCPNTDKVNLIKLGLKQLLFFFLIQIFSLVKRTNVGEIPRLNWSIYHPALHQGSGNITEERAARLWEAEDCGICCEMGSFIEDRKVAPMKSQ